jgi:Uma2 family endonuclease
MTARVEATVADLYRVKEKAELVNGEIVLMSPTGGMPGRTSSMIYVSLLRHEQRTQAGYAFPDNVGFLVDLPHRKSFSPDAAFHTEKPTMKFVQGAPLFAVEVRSVGDYGEDAERELAAKRADYFAAGTLVVWDVDLLGVDVVRVYCASAPDMPTIYRRSETAEAEPAVRDWTMAVDELFL